MSLFVIRHLPETDPPRFHVECPDQGERRELSTVPPAYGFPVEGHPRADLMQEIRWYLEEFLEYPFPPATERAERALRALHEWGRTAFEILFGTACIGSTRIWVRSDDPRVLSWPWEALRHPQKGPIGGFAQIERRLDQDLVLPPVAAKLPTDHLSILLITARPGAGDGFRSISRSLVELSAGQNLPIRIHLLRPPTLSRLRQHLRERPSTYHVVHFDGHGIYEKGFSGQMEGHLIFEDENAAPARIPGKFLGSILKQAPIPLVVLNACQSAMLDASAPDPFSATAVALLTSGAHSVVAMSHALYVSGAQRFLPAFYGSLFASGRVAEAVRTGRRAMMEKPGRICSRGRFDLEDWLLPVLYQHQDVDLPFAAEAPSETTTAFRPRLSGLDAESDHRRCIGRDASLLRIERALRRKPAAIVIHGLGGIGKTTLARSLIHWLEETDGLGAGSIWLPFQEISHVEEVLDRIEEPLRETPSGDFDVDGRVASLAARLRDEPWVVVWDHFNALLGVPETPRTPRIRPRDRKRLRSFLRALRGGRTKIIITSRHPEAWLGKERQLVPLGGLPGEHRWLLAEQILDVAGLTVPRDDANYRELMDLLRGHPLAMRMILPHLAHRRAEDLVAALRSRIEDLRPETSDHLGELDAILHFVEEDLPPELHPVLVPLAFHDGCVDADDLETMAEEAEPALTRTQIDRLMTVLVAAGLLHPCGRARFELHPVLTGFLRSKVLMHSTPEARKGWAESFVDKIATMADELAPLPLHEQDRLQRDRGNILSALAEAQRLERLDDQFALLQALAVYAQNRNHLEEAGDLFRQVVLLHRLRGDERNEAAAYHHLGMIAEERRAWQRAEKWYGKSLNLKEKLGDEQGAAVTCHQLGIVAEERMDPSAAERWYQRALAIRERIGDEQGLASTYHQLGIFAQKAGHLEVAEQWYLKALEIKKRLDDGEAAVSTYHQLGMLAEMREDFPEAKRWYRESLRLSRRSDNRYGMALTYHQLGSVTDDECDLEASEKWYRKAIQLFEESEHLHHAAVSYSMLAITVARQARFVEAGGWLIKAIRGLRQHHDSEREAWCQENYLLFYQQAPEADQEPMRSAWLEALGEWPLDEDVEPDSGER